jgi:hypothetical protein
MYGDSCANGGDARMMEKCQRARWAGARKTNRNKSPTGSVGGEILSLGTRVAIGSPILALFGGLDVDNGSGGFYDYSNYLSW